MNFSFCKVTKHLFNLNVCLILCFNSIAMTTVEKSDKRVQILAAAEELFAEKGFDGASVRDIAQRASVNLAMISYYFGSKEKLLEALIEDRAGYTFGILTELGKNTALTPWDKIDRLVEFYVDKVMNNYRFHCIMTQQYNNATRSADIKKLIANIKLKNYEQIGQIIREGQEKKMFRQVDTVFMMASMMGTLTHVVNSMNLYCQLLNIDDTDEAACRQELSSRLKTHLKQLLHAHLDIKNEEV